MLEIAEDRRRLFFTGEELYSVSRDVCLAQISCYVDFVVFSRASSILDLSGCHIIEENAQPIQLLYE